MVPGLSTSRGASLVFKSVFGQLGHKALVTVAGRGSLSLRGKVYPASERGFVCLCVGGLLLLRRAFVTVSLSF